MRAFLLLFLSLVSCRDVGRRPDVARAERTTEARFALEQILREIDAGKDPIGRMDPIPRTEEEAVTRLLGMGLGESKGDAPSVRDHEGFLICSFGPLDQPYWGQKGYAVNLQTGDVYEWSLW